ncbi:MAG: chloride channel protein [Candidatus Methanofastidiosia archaeon]
MYIPQRLNFEWKFYVLALIVGGLAGFGAIIFRHLISFMHNLFFEGKLSYIFDGNTYWTSSWGIFVVLVPICGFLIVGAIVNRWAPEAKGHGVPEVMASVFIDKGKIRPRVVGIKSLASALCIGSGGSVGREGPIVQIGAAIGSIMGQFLKLSDKETITLLGCGAAAGIAATFNAPIGGILFALELILPEFSVRTLVPLAMSTSFATYVSRYFLGSEPAFSVPSYALNSGYELLFYVIMGVLTGVVAILFIKILYKVEDIFDALNVSNYVKSIIGGAIVGIIGVILFRFYGHYFIFGVGYATIADVLTGKMVLSITFLLLLILLKIFATSVTIGCGGSGGIFAPSLFIGACFGEMFGIIINYIFPVISASPSAYANVGMGAMVAGTTGAALTPIIMFFEMTRDYSIILPLTISVVMAQAFIHYNHGGTIYTIKLLRRGINVPHEKTIDILSIIPVEDMMEECGSEDNLPKISRYSSAIDALVEMDERRVDKLMVKDEKGNCIGIVRKESILYVYEREIVDLKKHSK